MKKALRVLVLLLLSLSLTGCGGSADLTLLIVALGVDVDESGLTLTVKVPSYSGQTRGEDGGDGGGYLTLSVQGEDWPHALSLLLAASPLTLRYSQLREVVVSLSSLDRVPLKTLLEYVDSLQNVRSHAVVILCDGSAGDFVRRQQPEVGKRLSKYLSLSLANHERLGYIPSTSLGEALRDLSSAWRDPLLAYAALSDGEAQPDGVEQPMDLMGGQFRRGDADEGEYAGALAMGSTGEYVLLTGYEVQLYHLISGQEQLLNFVYGDRHYALELRGRQKMRLEKSDGKTTLVLSLPVTVLYSIYTTPPAGGVAAALESEIVSLLHKLQSAACDALGYGCLAVRDFATLPQWYACDWASVYRAADVRVEVLAQTRQSARF